MNYNQFRDDGIFLFSPWTSHLSWHDLSNKNMYVMFQQVATKITLVSRTKRMCQEKVTSLILYPFSYPMGNSPSSMPNPSAMAVQGTINLSGASAKPVIAGMVAPGQLGGIRNTHPPLESIVGGERFLLKTKDGFSLDALYVKARHCDEKKNPRGALCFHGNGMYLDAMGEFASFYLSRNVSVLLITMRGYPGSEGDVRNEGETGIYLDVAASVDYMIDKGFLPTDLIAHGFSLGGSLASAAAVHHELGALVLDHTFTSASQVSRPRAVDEISKISQWIPAWVGSSIAQGAMDATFQSGMDVDLGHDRIVKTDGLSSVDKVKKYQGSLVICYGTADHIMPVSFADDFEHAYEGERFIRIEIKGKGHSCDQFGDEEMSERLSVALGLHVK